MAVSAVLATSAAATGAAPAPEPLIITSHSEAMLTVTESGAAEQEPSIENAMQKFARAVGQAIQVQQQAVDAACKSAQRPKPGTPQVYDWGARCSYQRY